MKKLVFVFAVFSMAALTAADMLVNVSVEPAGSNCANGGVKIEVGADSNGNETLDSEEVIPGKTKYTCNGEDGSDGSAPVVSLATEGPSATCAAGGVKITVGSDSKYVCNGTDGTDGINALSKISEEPAGTNCANGGYKVEAGLDTDNDSSIDLVTDTQYVCNGADGSNGHNALTKITDEPKGQNSNCKDSGGIKIETGIDIDGDGELTGEEITDTQYLCNGKKGAPGDQGVKGYDALSRTSKEPEGANCANGGVKIEVGNDTNLDHVLNDNEVIAEQTKYVCNGEQGEKGETGPKGDQGIQGETGETGESGRNGAAALVSVVNEPKGANCAAGGKKIETGLDANGNGTLDEDEIDPADIHYVCNGRDAQEAGLSSSSGCAMTTVDGGFELIYALMAAVAALFAFFAAKIIRR